MVLVHIGPSIDVPVLSRLGHVLRLLSARTPAAQARGRAAFGLRGGSSVFFFV